MLQLEYEYESPFESNYSQIEILSSNCQEPDNNQ